MTTYTDRRSGKSWPYLEFLAIYCPGDVVSIDSGDVHATVTGHLWRNGAPMLEVQWMANGAMQSAYVDEWRLSMIKRYAEGDI